MARRRTRNQPPWHQAPEGQIGCLTILAVLFAMGAVYGHGAQRVLAFILALLVLGTALLLVWYQSGDGWQRAGVTSHPAQHRTTRCVYMLRAGPYYKIGKTNQFQRRMKDIQLQLPFSVEVVHRIATDDEAALEAYWHRRFAHRRANGEWFELTAAEVAEFTGQAEMYHH